MKPMFKAVAVIFIIYLVSFSASAIEKNEYFDSQMSASGAEELYSSIEIDTKDILSDLGIDRVDFDSLYDISPEKVFTLVKNVAIGKSKEPVKAALKLAGIIAALSIGGAFIDDDDKMNEIINTAGVLLCAAVMSVPLYETVNSAVSSIGMCCTFMKALIPVLAGAVIASGNPMTAISFQSWAFAAAQFISSVCQSFIIPVVGAVIAIDISSSLIPEFRLDAVTDLIKKTVISVLTFTSTLYVSFLGIKGVLSSSADSVAGKGIELIISSAVPVVGGALSEAYSGIIGSLALVKSTLGVFGIIAIAAITLPSVIQLLLWIFTLKICAAMGEMFIQEETSKLLNSLSTALVLMSAVLLFNCVLFIISLSLVISIR